MDISYIVFRLEYNIGTSTVDHNLLGESEVEHSLVYIDSYGGEADAIRRVKLLLKQEHELNPHSYVVLKAYS